MHRAVAAGSEDAVVAAAFPLRDFDGLEWPGSHRLVEDDTRRAQFACELRPIPLRAAAPGARIADDQGVQLFLPIRIALLDEGAGAFPALRVREIGGNYLAGELIGACQVHVHLLVETAFARGHRGRGF